MYTLKLTLVWFIDERRILFFGRSVLEVRELGNVLPHIAPNTSRFHSFFVNLPFGPNSFTNTSDRGEGGRGGDFYFLNLYSVPTTVIHKSLERNGLAFAGLSTSF